MAPGSAAYLIFLGGLAGLPALSIDMGLPSLPGIVASLTTTVGQAGSTLSLFVLGFAFAPIVSGPLADRYGRRPVLLGGLAMFVAAALLSSVAGSIGQLLLFRCVQGAGAGAASIMPMAIIRDAFRGTAAHRSLAHVTLVRGIAPAIAPVLGTVVLFVGDWRTINLALTGAGTALLAAAWFGFGETREGTRVDLTPRAILHAYGSVLSDTRIVANALFQAFSFATMFAWVAGAPLIVIGLFGIGPSGFSLIFAATSLSIMAGSWLCGRIAGRAGLAEAALGATVAAVLASTVALAALSRGGVPPLPLLMPLLLVANFGFGMIAPTAWHRMMGPRPELAGYVSAFGSGVQMLAGAGASWLVAAFFDGRSTGSMSQVMAGSAVAAACSYVATRRWRADLS